MPGSIVEPLVLINTILANKFFDYIQAGIPQVTMNFPEYAAINREYEVAVLIDDLEPHTFPKRWINYWQMRSYRRLKNNCVLARKNLNWESEEKSCLRFIQMSWNDRQVSSYRLPGYTLSNRLWRCFWYLLHIEMAEPAGGENSPALFWVWEADSRNLKDIAIGFITIQGNRGWVACHSKFRISLLHALSQIIEYLWKETDILSYWKAFIQVTFYTTEHFRSAKSSYDCTTLNGNITVNWERPRDRFPKNCISQPRPSCWKNMKRKSLRWFKRWLFLKPTLQLIAAWHPVRRLITCRCSFPGTG